MTRQETVEKYQEAFLAGRTDEQRAQFQAKDVNKQYASIKQWMRKSNLKEPANDSGKLSAILKMVRSIHKSIEKTPTLSDKDLERIHAELDTVKELLSDYDTRVRKVAYRKELERDLKAVEADENKNAIRRANIEKKLAEL
ncbi:MAG: hypothetical protein K2H47_05425 [Muribaculaceae bacterium]|nr:hypothetical protein [Muribaculaceae bacterium]